MPLSFQMKTTTTTRTRVLRMMKRKKGKKGKKKKNPRKLERKTVTSLKFLYICHESRAKPVAATSYKIKLQTLSPLKYYHKYYFFLFPAFFQPFPNPSDFFRLFFSP